MVKKFNIPCDFNGQAVNTDFFVGNPREENHPIEYQAKWLGEVRGGIVPKQVMDSIKRIQEIAMEKKVPFEDLCIYAINMANEIPQDKNKNFDTCLIDANNKKLER